MEERKARNLPDPSYDLDGDGIISAREYFLAKHFDQDKDGKLNSREKKNALRSLENGYEKNFVWNVEETGPFRGHRLLQIRGEFIDGEDFIPVRNTYPKHPMSDIKPHVKNKAELDCKRKEEIMNCLKTKRDEWEKMNPRTVLQECKVNEFFVDNPTYFPCMIVRNTSLKQIRSEKILQARKDAGLSEEITSLKDDIVTPTLAYIEHPAISSRSELEAKHRADNVI
jgi:hypothetical protein